MSACTGHRDLRLPVNDAFRCMQVVQGMEDGVQDQLHSKALGQAVAVTTQNAGQCSALCPLQNKDHMSALLLTEEGGSDVK